MYQRELVTENYFMPDLLDKTHADKEVEVFLDEILAKHAHHTVVSHLWWNLDSGPGGTSEAESASSVHFGRMTAKPRKPFPQVVFLETAFLFLEPCLYF